jgi:hypothetical protein
MPIEPRRYILKPAYKLFICVENGQAVIDPCERMSCSYDQVDLHPHISAAPTLGVRKNMLSAFYLSPTLREDTYTFQDFYMLQGLSSSMCFKEFIVIIVFKKLLYPRMRHGAMQNKRQKNKKV